MIKQTVPRATKPRQVWSLDFQFDSTWRGKTIKMCDIIDEFTRQHVAYRVDTKITTRDVVEILDVASCEYGGRPAVIRMDNGPEFIAQALADWASEADTVQAFIPPGQPWHNGMVESLHNRIRDELLEVNCIENLEHARKLMAWWSRRYSEEHPHSSLGYLTPNEFARKHAQDLKVGA